jgi:hypothetical protein
MATAKQRAWRAKFAQLYGNKGKKRKMRRASAGDKMARRGRKFGRKRSGMGGMGGIVKPFLVGAALGVFGNAIPIVGGIEPMATGAAAGFLVKRNIAGAGAGAAGGYIGSRYLKGMMGMGGTTSTSGTIFY